MKQQDPIENEHFKKAEILSRFAIEELRLGILILFTLLIILGYGLAPGHEHILSETGFKMVLGGLGILSGAVFLVAARTGKKVMNLIGENYEEYSSLFIRILISHRVISIGLSSVGMVLIVSGTILLLSQQV